MENLDPLHIPLAGINLIEASAGTGKTRAITTLYLRLVVEAALVANRILVVTYTNAATNELRVRIRERLLQIRDAFLNSQAPEDDELANCLLSLTSDNNSAIRQLTNAACSFDEAAIFTIHGFCKRVLVDSAFENGLPFKTKLIADTKDLLREVVEDFWRREFYNASPIMVQYFLDQHYSPEMLLEQIEQYLNKPYVQTDTIGNESDRDTLEQVLTTKFLLARDLWLTHRANIEDILLNSSVLNRQIYSLKSLPSWLEAMHEYLTLDVPKVTLFKNFEKFTTPILQAPGSVKKGKTAPYNPFFDACQALKVICRDIGNYYSSQISDKLLEWCKSETSTRKFQKQVQSYDDLLLNMHAVLRHPRKGNALVESLRKRYSAILIDEFQDTDPMQYEIFSHIYTGTSKPVFLVGDPKQAIYSFRGADIFTYLSARCAIPNHYTLDVNWRSDTLLVTALNAVFGTTKQPPFLFDSIPFQKACPTAEHRRLEKLWIRDNLEPPLRLWFLKNYNSDQPVSRSVAVESVVWATAAEISRLLNLGARGCACIGETPYKGNSRALVGGDIAVLVQSHWQGKKIRNALLQLGVPSIQHASDSVFTSPEACQMEWLLSSFLEPNNEDLARLVLASDLFGLCGEDLYKLREDEQAWSDWLGKLHDYRQLWLKFGFMQVFRTLLVREHIPQRLLAFRDGKRRLTNFLHLSELLHLTSCLRPSGGDLLKWLRKNRCSPSNKDEGQQYRLESDENLVRIVTVHKSKGLEYPVVFCPFFWDGRLSTEQKAKRNSLYHSADDFDHISLFFGVSDDNNLHQQARREEVSEKLRLFYVALTRAKQRCYVSMGKIRGAETSPIAWLLHQPLEFDKSQDAIEITSQRFQAMSSKDLLYDLHSVLEESSAISLELLPQEPAQRYQPPTIVDEPELTARSFTGSIKESCRVSSFTRLITSQHYVSPLLEEQQAESITTIVGRESGILEFPRGVRAGICLHTILEKLDFTEQNREYLELLVERTLIKYGFDVVNWKLIVADMVKRVLETPLDVKGDIQLARVAPEQRLNELEFHYFLNHLSSDSLKSVLERHLDSPFCRIIDMLEFSPFRGYMRGYIDLIFEYGGKFYIVDYKSNWLGVELIAYRRNKICSKG